MLDDRFFYAGELYFQLNCNELIFVRSVERDDANGSPCDLHRWHVDQISTHICAPVLRLFQVLHRVNLLFEPSDEFLQSYS